MASYKDSKGTYRGSVKNLYGGVINPTREDFVEFVRSALCMDQSKQSGAKLFACTQLCHVTADYLFFGLGRNGYHVVSHFFEAVEFLFRARSYLPETWKDSPAIEQVFVDPVTKKRVKTVTVPAPETLKLQCFDTYYEVAEVGQAMHMDVFLDLIKKKRRDLILLNHDQVSKCMDVFRRGCLSFLGGQQEFIWESLDSPEAIEALVYPKSPEELESLFTPLGLQPLKAFRARTGMGGVRKARPYQIFIVDGQLEFALSEAA